MSALIGIAIEQGHIAGVEVPVVDILGRKVTGPIDERLKALTLKDLLTMQTGLHSKDSYLYQWRGLFEMQKTEDWAAHILNLPMDVAPGTRFDYSNMSSFLLSAIIMATTGTDTLSFAKTNLFAPLGIEDIRWAQSPQGIHIGWARMWLKPHDMAKIGLLYLQNGRWEDKQIIPSAWIADSTRAHSFPKRYRHFQKELGKVDYFASALLWLFTKLARPFADGYGYQWWLDQSGMYSAIGVGGQYIIVIPEHEMVVVFTSKLSGAGSFFPIKLLKKFILPAVLSDEALPANRRSQEQLESLSNPPEMVTKVKTVAELPPIAGQISGETYALESNLWNYDNLWLSFDPAESYAEFAYTNTDDKLIQYQVGLDNVHRLTDSLDGTYAAKGEWTTPTTFTIDYELVGYSNRGQWILTFADDGVVVKEVSVTGEQVYQGKKR